MLDVFNEHPGKPKKKGHLSKSSNGGLVSISKVGLFFATSFSMIDETSLANKFSNCNSGGVSVILYGDEDVDDGDRSELFGVGGMFVFVICEVSDILSINFRISFSKNSLLLV